MSVEFDIKLTLKDVYRFNMYQAYSGSQGWIAGILAILLFIKAVNSYGTVSVTYTLLYAALAVVFLLYIPVGLYMRSKKRLESSEALRNTLHYAVSDSGIVATQGEESGELKWDQIYKMIATKSNVLIYSNRINAYVIPREQLGEKYTALAELANKNLEKHRVKMR